MVWLNEAFGGKFPVTWSLGIIASLLATAIAASLLVPARSPAAVNPRATP
jgi:tellurite resistance protein TerC